MKRAVNYLILLAVLTMMIFCPGCTGLFSQPEEDPDAGLLVVGFSQVGSESDWRLANTSSMVSALSEKNGYRLLFDNAKQKQENQYRAIRNFIQQDVDYIVLAPISETGWENVLREARAAGIPVIVVDRQVSVEDESLYRSWVGSDFYQEGKTAVSWLEQEYPGEDTPLRILHLQGTEGATAQLMRSRALEEAASRHGNWTIEAALQGEFTEAKGYEVVRDFLETGTDFDILYSENDNMTFGALRALDEAGISYGRDGKVKILSFDAVRGALELCLEGKINICIECNPLHGPRVDRLIQSCEKGEAVQKASYVEETFFTCDTITGQIIEAREY